MSETNDLKITGIDENRPPLIRKEPYIDLHFKLSHKAPEDWCKDFNALFLKHPTKPRIKEGEGIFIDGWVKMTDEIEEFLEQLKDAVTTCNDQHKKRIELAIQNARSASQSQGDDDIGEQGRLNKIIDALDYGVKPVQ